MTPSTLPAQLRSHSRHCCGALPGVASTINETAFTIIRAVLLIVAAAVLLGFRFHGSVVDAVAVLVVLVSLGRTR